MTPADTTTAAPTAAALPAVPAAAPDQRRTRPVWKPLAAAGIGSAVLLATGFGVFATLTATASGTAQQVTSGSLGLVLGSTGAGFTQSVTNVAPTDTVYRFVTLTNNGTLDAQQLSLNLAATGSSALVTDGTTTRALQATVTTCPAAFTDVTTTTPAGTCTTGATELVKSATLSTLLGKETTVLAGPRAAAEVLHLRVALTLPDQNENTHNGATPAPGTAGTIQNQTAQLTWTFRQAQRTGTTTSA